MLLMHAFHEWRRTRPFWAGTLCAISGALVVARSLMQWSAVLDVGSATLIGIGLGFIAGGLALCLSSRDPKLVAVVLMIAAVCCPVVAHDGFPFETVVGMLGASMAFGWQPDAELRASRSTAIAVVACLVGATSLAPLTAPSASAQVGDRPAYPLIGHGSGKVVLDVAKARNLRLYLDPVVLTDGHGHDEEVVQTYWEKAELTNYRLTSPGGALSLKSDLYIENVELLGPRLKPNLDLGTLILGLVPTSLLSDLLGPLLGDIAKLDVVTIDPQLIRTLAPLKALPPPYVRTDSHCDCKYLAIPVFDVGKGPGDAHTTWDQSYIRGDIYLSGAEITVDGPLPRY